MRVYNRRRGDAPLDAVYVGRGSPWGNPFGMHSEKERDYACDMFETQILPTLDVSELRGKNLVCWCAPKRCHADAILKKANLSSTGPSSTPMSSKGKPMNRCSCCHQIIPPKIYVRGKKQEAIYEYIASHPQGARRDQIIAHIYKDDIDGGPDNAVTSFYVMVQRLNRNIRKYGLKIVGSMKTGVYTVAPLDPNTPSREQILWSEAVATAFSAAALYPFGTSGS